MKNKKVKLKLLTGGLAKSGPKLDQQVDKLYSMNKNVIKKYVPSTEFRTRKEVFTEHIKQLVADGYTINQAAIKMARSRAFLSRNEIARENFLEGFKEDTDLYNRFRKMKGWNTKFDMNKLQYKGEQGKDIIYYYYSGKGIIKIIKQKSPDGETEGGYRLVAPELQA